MNIKSAIITFLVAILSIISTTAQQNNVDEQKKIIASLEASIAQSEKKLSSLKKDKSTIQRRVQTLVQQISKRNALIKATNKQINNLTAEINRSTRRLRVLSSRYNSLENSCAQMFCAAYRDYRSGSKWAFIFDSKSVTEAVRRVALLRTATEKRTQKMHEIDSVQVEIRIQKEELDNQRSELNRSKQNLDKQKKQLNKDVTAARASISKMSAQEKQVLQAKSAQEGRLDEAIRRLRTLTKGNKTGSSFSPTSSSLRLPVIGGRVKKYNGNMAEIVGAEGAAVVSIYEGKVVEVRNDKVSGKYIVYIAHGEYISSYANLSATTVAKNAVVKQNQKIGTIGSAVNFTTMDVEYKMVFGIYAPSPSIKLNASQCFRK